MTCQEAHKLVVQAQDGRLPLIKHLGLRFHVFICKSCTAFGRQMEFLRAACRSFPGDED
jgi:hypothetical protein